MIKKKILALYLCIVVNTISSHEHNNSLESKMIDDIEQEYELIINKSPDNINTEYEWTIIGAGPAGIIATAMLLDLGIEKSKILWIDKVFTVGRMGEYYTQINGNTTNQTWINFLQSSATISALTEEYISYFQTLIPTCYSTLDKIVAPLQKVTNHFLTIIDHEYGYLDALDFSHGIWHVSINNKIHTTKNVILAIGSSPIVQNYDEAKSSDIVPLDYALNKDFLKLTMKQNDIVAVFGGAHSAMLILKYLSDLETPVKAIYNFYNKKNVYAMDPICPLLKNNQFAPIFGVAAWWVNNVLAHNPPKNLHRVENTADNRKAYLPQCNKVIYAIGYKINTLPCITINNEIITEELLSFDHDSGIIGPRLFGIGIAFPGIEQDAQGNQKVLIGVPDFLKYALHTMPQWIKKQNNIEHSLNIMAMTAKLSDYLIIEIL